MVLALAASLVPVLAVAILWLFALRPVLRAIHARPARRALPARRRRG